MYRVLQEEENIWPQGTAPHRHPPCPLQQRRPRFLCRNCSQASTTHARHHPSGTGCRYAWARGTAERSAEVPPNLRPSAPLSQPAWLKPEAHKRLSATKRGKQDCIPQPLVGTRPTRHPTTLPAPARTAELESTFPPPLPDTLLSSRQAGELTLPSRGKPGPAGLAVSPSPPWPPAAPLTMTFRFHSPSPAQRQEATTPPPPQPPGPQPPPGTHWPHSAPSIRPPPRWDKEALSLPAPRHPGDARTGRSQPWSRLEFVALGGDEATAGRVPAKAGQGAWQHPLQQETSAQRAAARAGGSSGAPEEGRGVRRSGGVCGGEAEARKGSSRERCLQ